jgi:hypothetical protein
MSNFREWVEQQDKIRDWDDMTPTDQMGLAWNAGRKHAEKERDDWRACATALAKALEAASPDSRYEPFYGVDVQVNAALAAFEKLNQSPNE